MSVKPCLPFFNVQRFAAFVLGALLFAIVTPLAAEDHTVNVGGSSFRFNPADLTIQTGDTVTWINRGGFHNVSATSGDDFRCSNGCDGDGGSGDPSSNSWSFTLTFNAPGTIAYRCEVHGGQGMVGSLTVEGGGAQQNGQVRLTNMNLTIAEDGGSAMVTVERTSGTDGAVSVDYATADGSAAAGSDYTAATGTLAWANGEGGSKSFAVQVLDDALEEGDEQVNVMLSNATGGATLGSPSSGTVTIQDNDAQASAAGSLRFSAAAYEAAESDDVAVITVDRVGGDSGAVGVSFATADGSAQSGLDYESASGELSWADGDATDKSFEVRIVDDAAPEAAETVNLMLSAPTGDAALGNRSAATLTIDDDDTSFPACSGSDTTLCVGVDDRFQLDVDFRTANGQSGPGRTVTLEQRDGGLFFFFDVQNPEMLVKVLNGCSLNDRYWVFFAATTNVEFTLTVTDTEGGAQKIYVNPLNQPANAVTDTDAFATCP